MSLILLGKIPQENNALDTLGTQTWEWMYEPGYHLGRVQGSWWLSPDVQAEGGKLLLLPGFPDCVFLWVVEAPEAKIGGEDHRLLKRD